MQTPLVNKQHRFQYLLYGGLAALGYTVAAAVFIGRGQFQDAWWMYVGNALFMGCIFVYSRVLSGQAEDKKSAMTMLMAGHTATVTGIIMSCVLLTLLLFIFIPGLLHSGVPENKLKNAPAANVPDKANGLIFMIFINAIIVNFCAGSFISLITSYATKRNQTKDKPAELN